MSFELNSACEDTKQMIGLLIGPFFNFVRLCNHWWCEYLLSQHRSLKLWICVKNRNWQTSKWPLKRSPKCIKCVGAPYLESSSLARFLVSQKLGSRLPHDIWTRFRRRCSVLARFTEVLPETSKIETVLWWWQIAPISSVTFRMNIQFGGHPGGYRRVSDENWRFLKSVVLFIRQKRVSSTDLFSASLK